MSWDGQSGPVHQGMCPALTASGCRGGPVAFSQGAICPARLSTLVCTRCATDRPTPVCFVCRLSVLVHPDKNPGEEARAAFEALNEAHRILKDPSRLVSTVLPVCTAFSLCTHMT